VNKDAHARIPTKIKKAAAWEWRCRHQFEREASVRFTRMAEALKEHDAPDQVIAMAHKAADDEVRHAQLCRDLVHYFNEDFDPNSPLSVKEVSPAHLSSSQKLLYEVVAMSCITETLSCALLGALSERAHDQRVKETMHSILRDEIVHSRLGWAYLTSVGSSQDLTFLAEYLPSMLAGTVTEEIFQKTKPPVLEQDMIVYGALGRAQRLSIFVESMRLIVFPGLEQFGIDTSLAKKWLDEKTQTEELPQ
jgi:hypothetical protein